MTGSRKQTDLQISRERTYVEGDQLNYFSTTGEEIAVWKLRHRQRGGGAGSLLQGVGTDGCSSFRSDVGVGGGGGGGGGRGAGGSTAAVGAAGGLAGIVGNGKTVTQCLRCNQFFKPSENNNRACRYHKKGRQIREQYDPSGRLHRVLYTWACCKKGLDAPGCTYGGHI